MKKTMFRNMLAFAMAAAIGVGFTSCSNDDVYAITDNNDDEWLVRHINGISCFYDKDNKLTSIIDDFDEIYYVTADGTLTIAWADKKGSSKAQITLNDDNNITKFEYSGIKIDDEKWEGTYDFNYNDGRLLSYTATSKKENLNKNNIQNSWTSSTARIGATFTWANENLTSWTVNKNMETEINNASSVKTNSTDTYTYSYSSQENPCKQFPYLIGNSLGIADNKNISGLFSALGLYGYGPKQLPFSCKYTYEYTSGTNISNPSNYTYAFTLNENGTLNSETRYSEGNTSGSTYSYIYTPTRAGGASKQSLKELIRNMCPRNSFERNEQEQ